MNKKTIVLATGLLLVALPLFAQSSRRGSSRSMGGIPEHRLEVIPMYGYAWTVSQSATYNSVGGDLDIKSGTWWGIAVDVNSTPWAQLRLIYRRQESALTFKQAGVTQDLGELDVEYYQIGGLKGLPQGNVKPYSGLSLGATRYVANSGEDNWKFSIIISLGAKIYLNDRIGLMLGGDMPWTFTDAFLGIGTGGLSVGGTGIVQFDVVGGVMIML